MAVPKKKTSKGKRNQRHAIWKAKAATAAERALSIGNLAVVHKDLFIQWPTLKKQKADNPSDQPKSTVAMD